MTAPLSPFPGHPLTWEGPEAVVRVLEEWVRRNRANYGG